LQITTDALDKKMSPRPAMRVDYSTLISQHCVRLDYWRLKVTWSKN